VSRQKPIAAERESFLIRNVQKIVHLGTLVLLEQKLSLIGILRKLVFLLALLCFVVLVVTGFYPVLIWGEHLTGWLLMIHATFAPVFAVCLAILAVMWADRCRFDKTDCPVLQRLIHGETATQEPAAGGCHAAQKVCFWLIVLLSLPLILSIVLSMFKLFGAEGQKFLLEVHRYSALFFALAAFVYLYLAIKTQTRQ
jgi:cytochrome b subunit of formate dehydrogenase